MSSVRIKANVKLHSPRVCKVFQDHSQSKVPAGTTKVVSVSKVMACAELLELIRCGVVSVVGGSLPVTEPTPEVTEPTPEVTETAPEVTEPTPEVTETAPEVTETAPEVTETAPEVTESAEVEAPKKKRGKKAE